MIHRDIDIFGCNLLTIISLLIHHIFEIIYLVYETSENYENVPNAIS